MEKVKQSEPQSIEAYKLIDIVDLVVVAKNALMLLEDFQTDINNPVDGEINSLKQRLDDMMKDKYVNHFITLDDDFNTDTVNTIMKNSRSVPSKGKQEEVLATAFGGIINVTGRLAEHVRMAENADIKLDELQDALVDSEFEKENFWAYRSIMSDLDEARERLVPLLANTKRVRS